MASLILSFLFSLLYLHAHTLLDNRSSSRGFKFHLFTACSIYSIE